ncbi:hypothetical protein NDU88_001907 [Pleurodeles waltl]|uniref:Uncharacterized protein n=1 Tax=Pleurodeles waltl TaxID=8319 RepID=A0AAV7QA60_PLEWA|nr:hypothetical protein NDU88_001907 [Pleurodeles waltl]
MWVGVASSPWPVGQYAAQVCPGPSRFAERRAVSTNMQNKPRPRILPSNDEPQSRLPCALSKFFIAGLERGRCEQQKCIYRAPGSGHKSPVTGVGHQRPGTRACLYYQRPSTRDRALESQAAEVPTTGHRERAQKTCHRGTGTKNLPREKGTGERQLHAICFSRGTGDRVQ